MLSGGLFNGLSKLTKTCFYSALDVLRFSRFKHIVTVKTGVDNHFGNCFGNVLATFGNVWQRFGNIWQPLKVMTVN